MAVVGAGQARAQTSFIFTLQQIDLGGGNFEVVGTGNGSIDTDPGAGLENAGTDDTAFAYINSDHANMAMGSTAVTTGHAWQIIGFTTTGTTSIGTGSLVSATTSAGNIVAFDGTQSNATDIFVPNGYVSGTTLTDSGTWVGSTYSSLQIDPGTYVWTWGTGNSFTIDVMPFAVPETSQYGWMVFLGLGGLTGWKRFSRRVV